MPRDGASVICPYCGYEHGDAWEFCPQDTPKELECNECGKTFIGWAEYDVDYCTRPLSDVEKGKDALKESEQ